MATLEALKQAIAGLPEPDRQELLSWLQTMDQWECQMLRDFAIGGRGHHLVEKVRDSVRTGNFEPMPER